REEAFDDLEHYVDLFGDSANGCYAFYMRQDNQLADEVSVAVVQKGEVRTISLNTTAHDVIEVLSRLKENELSKALLRKAELSQANLTKDTKVFAKDYLDVTSKRGELEQKAIKIYDDKATAMKNLLCVVDVLGDKSAEGAYAIIREPEKKE